jgi:hypothetical protein
VILEEATDEELEVEQQCIAEDKRRGTCRRWERRTSKEIHRGV